MLYKFPILISTFILSLNLHAGPTAFFPQSVASGDPTDVSVILWARLVDGDTAVDRNVTLKVSTEGTLADVGTTNQLGGANLYTGGVLTAPAANDGCVKVRVTGLAPDTTYYYQFTYDDGGPQYSPIGRTKTAPEVSADEVIQFAVFNCSDYSGRYYNTLKHLNEQESETLDFVLHLGDYIYETTADPSFQTADPNRRVAFTDQAGAIDFGSFKAAKSLSNYRELYKTYRSDPNLIRAHELYPWVVIWDDHEYSDDNWGAVATFFDGKVDESDPVRKRVAEQAWYEFIPCGLGLNAGGTQLEVTADDLYPNTAIYRSLNFGANLDLILTDNRTHRPDHLIPEDAFPGKIALDETTSQATVEAIFGPDSFALFRSSFDPYFNIDDAAYNQDLGLGDGSTYKQVIIGIVASAAQAELDSTPSGQTLAYANGLDYASQVVTGLVSATWVNNLLDAAAAVNPALSSLKFDAGALAAMERGISHFLMGKTANFIDFGARYQIIDQTFQVYAGALYKAFIDSSGALGRDQAFYDAAQQNFLASALGTSSSRGTTWRVVASSSPFTPIKLNLGSLPQGTSLPDSGTITGGNVFNGSVPAQIPSDFLNEFLVNGDEVAGFPTFRGAMVDLFAAHDVVLVSGDIHASMLGKNRAPSSGEIVIDFTAPSTSSSNFRNAYNSALGLIESLMRPAVLAATGNSTGNFVLDGRESFLEQIDKIVTHNSSELEYVNSKTHGYLVVRASGSELIGEFREIDVANITIDKQSQTAEGIDSLFTRKPYAVTKASGDLVLTQGDVILALSRFDGVKIGDRVVIPAFASVPNERYRIELTTNLADPGSWSTVAASDILSIDGADLDASGLIVGNGNNVASVLRIPASVASESSVFFRVQQDLP